MSVHRKNKWKIHTGLARGLCEHPYKTLSSPADCSKACDIKEFSRKMKTLVIGLSGDTYQNALENGMMNY